MMTRVSNVYHSSVVLTYVLLHPQEHWEREFSELQLEFDIPFR